jgi:hypothetical protein
MIFSPLKPSISRQNFRTIWMTAKTTPVLSFPAAILLDRRSSKRIIQSIQTCTMDQTRGVWVVSGVGQDFMNRIRPLLEDFHVESEESL